ncbi:hypothetical protein [Humisphaera borealis]|uniref:DUF155 domain-containing protein n=1 Tax=Humisphaera borealis TaxID=2807512 RepID=A0A7M2WW12_9BACT|nr:hypothetical protein [Humisphaera borealis]QOV89402.1 hypothetical protein IPV69_24910 [Humisphaera borealis]
MPHGLPENAEVLDIAFLADRSAEQIVVLEFPHAIRCRAVRVAPPADGSAGGASPNIDLSVLAIPTSDHQDEVLLRAAGTWVGQGGAVAAEQVQLMTLQGAQILWCGPRVAVMAQPERIQTVRAAMIEAFYYQTELADIERTLGEAWPQLEGDMPLAFEFNNRAISRRNQLLQRFQQVLKIRVRLARLGPLVHSPHVHPATLASQIGERFRERTRMVHRHEALGEQLEVFEKVYESCGQRVSDFMLSRSSTTLEWVIIVLLVVQLVLNGVEYLVGLSP